MFLNSCHYILLDSTLASQHQCHCYYVLAYCLLHLYSQQMDITFLFLLFLLACSAAVFATLIVPFTIMYAWLQSYKLDFNIVGLNLIWLPVPFVPCSSLFISTQLFVLNLDGWLVLLLSKFHFLIFHSFPI